MCARERCSRRPAYTLVELVTVIGILAILAVAVGGPTLSYAAEMRSRTAAARIASDLAYIQRYAMSSRQRTWAAFSVAQNRYNLYVEDASNPGKANRLALEHPMTNSSAAIQLGSGEYAGVTLVSVSVGAGTEVEFDSFGKPYDAVGTAISTGGTITLSNGVTLTLHPITGLVEQSG